MRSLPLAIGFLLVMISIPGYIYTPIMIAGLVHTLVSFGGGNASASSSVSMLKQMGYPSRTVVISMMQYSFAGMEVAGLGLLLFGFVAKKKTPKKVAPKIVAEAQVVPTPEPTEKPQPNLRSIRILEERLAKGEITAIQFQSLKKLLD